ncbi:tetratricopeptide repeat protein, partial [Cellvibrio sp.]
SPHVQVVDVPYVLHLLDVAGGDMKDRIQLANRIFEISGSSLVVDLELAGSVNDYRLLYRLFTPTGQTSGVIMENQLDKVVESLAKVIAAKTDARLELSHLNKEFNSNLVAEAWDKWSKGQTDAAIALLKTAVTLEPDNFLAYQLLIESEQIQARWAQSKDEANNIIATAGQQQYNRAYVFYYLLARAEFALGDIEQAQKHLLLAGGLAEREFDSLYQAYITSLRGDIAQQAGDLNEAEGFYSKAMGHHQSIACPIGVSVTRLKLIDLYRHQKRNDLLVEQMSQLKELIAKHKLPIELPNLMMN